MFVSEVKVLVAQSCPTLCNPMDCSPPGAVEFSRKEYWSGLPCPPPGSVFANDLPNLIRRALSLAIFSPSRGDHKSQDLGTFIFVSGFAQLNGVFPCPTDIMDFSGMR